MSAIRWMFHSTAMVSDYDVTCDRLALLAGLRVLEYSESTRPGVSRRGGMCWIGDQSLEIGEPLDPAAAAARFVAKTGGGMHSVAVQVADVDAAIAHVESCGVKVAARPREEMFFTDPRDTHGVFIEWAAFEMHVDPHFGATPPPVTVDPLLSVSHHAFIGAAVSDPRATAEMLARLFGTCVTFDDPSPAPGGPRAGVSVGDCTLALYDMPADGGVDLWGIQLAAPRTHVLGLAVADFETAPALLDEHGYTVVRRTDTSIVLDPATCGGVVVELVDRLLPGDPRLG